MFSDGVKRALQSLCSRERGVKPLSKRLLLLYGSFIIHHIHIRSFEQMISFFVHSTINVFLDQAFESLNLLPIYTRFYP